MLDDVDIAIIPGQFWYTGGIYFINFIFYAVHYSTNKITFMKHASPVDEPLKKNASAAAGSPPASLKVLQKSYKSNPLLSNPVYPHNYRIFCVISALPEQKPI